MQPESSNHAPKTAAPRDPSQRAVVAVAGMRCDNCAASVEKLLREIDGVTNPSVSFALGEARFEFNPDLTQAEEIHFRLTDAGYPASAQRVAGVTSSGRKGDRDGSEGMDDDVTCSRRLRMGVGLGLSALIMLLSMGPERLGFPDFPGRMFIVFLAAGAVQIFVGREYYEGALRAARLRTTNMDTLVALGSSVAFGYSAVVFLLDLDPTAFPVYFESASMIVTLVMVGKFLEARAKRDAGLALRSLLDHQPNQARVERGGERVEVETDSIALGEIVWVEPGEKIPLDGTVLSGSSYVDESALTGESDPVSKTSGENVFAGTINRHGAFRFKTTALAQDTTFAVLVRLVREASASRAPIGTQVDQIARIFVPVILSLAFVVALVWLLSGSTTYFPEIHPLATALIFAAATLLISCPCAMGLATPLALIAGTGVGASRGLLIKSATALETAGKLSVVLFDKTGTLTDGRPTVLESHSQDGSTERLLRLAASVEQYSEHPLAGAIVEAAETAGVPFVETAAFEALPGKGVAATFEGKRVAIGNRRLMRELAVQDVESLPSVAAQERAGRTVVFVSVDGDFLGWIATGDGVASSAARAVSHLRRLGVTVAMLTGDDEQTAQAVARDVGIEDSGVFAGVLPADKAAVVEKFQAQGEIVAMVGDGINDAPALARADVGIAIGAGTDIALESSDLVLMHPDIERVAHAIKLSRRTLRTIQQNLFWAFAYNVAAIPLAAGALIPWFGPSARLEPGVAAGAMALSSLFVVLNSVRLRRSGALSFLDGKA